MKLDSREQIMDLLAQSFASGSLQLTEAELGENFFDLSTGVAGELFQKFLTYQNKLALVVSDISQYNDRVQELAYEHRNHPCVRFVETEQQAQAWLQQEMQTDTGEKS